MSENTSSLAHTHGCRQLDSDGVSSTVLAGKCQTLLLEKTKENSQLDLALVQPWTRFFVLCVEKPLTGTGNVPNLSCYKEDDLTQGAAGDRWQQWVDLSGLASGTVWCSPEGDLAQERFWLPFLFLVWVYSLRYDKVTLYKKKVSPSKTNVGTWLFWAVTWSMNEQD